MPQRWSYQKDSSNYCSISLSPEVHQQSRVTWGRRHRLLAFSVQWDPPSHSVLPVLKLTRSQSDSLGLFDLCKPCASGMYVFPHPREKECCHREISLCSQGAARALLRVIHANMLTYLLRYLMKEFQLHI
jgi:hypothetical protein